VDGIARTGAAKKLIEAARHWAAGPRGDNGEALAADAAAFGLTLPEMPQEDEGDTCEIWPENVETLEVFVSCGTQWRVDPTSGTALGLDYSGVIAAIDMMGVARTRKLFDDLRAMERAAIKELNRKHGR
jgi:hypothetical protein